MLMFRLLFTDSAIHRFSFAAFLPAPPCFSVRTIHGLILPVIEEDFPTLDVNRQYIYPRFTFQAPVILPLHSFSFQHCISYM
ncbi:hypothetical protein B0H13DRAFT_2017920 [Mycena leptocephala]|nr:hypothetical protein B0H13DRAFT_2017920 [Mycena leptocephala]